MAYTTINKGSSYFNTVLYTGTGSSQSITGVGFKPDWVWSKGRSNAVGNLVYDVLRGTNISLSTYQTRTEETDSPTALTAFNSDGFSLGSNGGVNQSAYTYVAWNWLANGTGVSNTSGTITSTVSANTTAGFSIVTYTGTGSNATVGHGLGVAPKVIIEKCRTNVTAWVIAFDAAGFNFANDYYQFDTSAKRTDGASTIWRQAPTSSVFSLGTEAGVNGSGRTHIAYCFAEVKGFSKFGSYTGNGSTDGPFTYTGFRPSFFLIKNTTTAGNGWHIFDNKRIGFNTSNYQLSPNDSGVEDTTTGYTDILSNGFKMRSTNDFNNKSGDTYIYMAFAENPFVTSSGIPVTAR